MGLPQILTHRWFGLAAVLVASTIAFFLIAGGMDTPWLDEAYTIRMINFEPQRIVELTRADAHPPGYYLLLKSWLKLFRLAGFEPGLLHARIFGLVSFFVLLGIIWACGRRAIGIAPAAVVTWGIALAPRMIEAVAELRQYSLAAPLTIAAFFAMVAAWQSARDESTREKRKSVLFGVGAAFLATVALWLHLLTVLVLALVAGAAWLLMMRAAFVSRNPRAIWIVPLLVAVPAVLFAPWIIFGVARNLQHLGAAKQVWMTPPTLTNLVLVFVGWMPFGQSFHYTPRWLAWFTMVLSFLALALPLIAWMFSLLRAKEKLKLTSIEVTALLALLIALLNVIICWLAARVEIQVFHAPRYPVLILGFYVSSILLFAVAAARRFAQRHVSVVFSLPLIIVYLAAFVFVAQIEYTSDYSLPVEMRGELLPRDQEPVYVMPSEFIPYLRGDYTEYRLSPVEELRNHPAHLPDAIVLRAAGWPNLDNERDVALRDAMSWNRLSHDFEFTECNRLYMARLVDVRRDAIHRITKVPWESIRLGAGDKVVSIAAPEWQESANGWYQLEYTKAYKTMRRAIASPAFARFNYPLPAGDYVLRMRGYQHPYPELHTTYRFQFQGEPSGVEFNIGTEHFDIRVPISLAEEHEKPNLAIYRPIWHPHQFIEGSEDLRPFAFTYYDMWIEPAN